MSNRMKNYAEDRLFKLTDVTAIGLTGASQIGTSQIKRVDNTNIHTNVSNSEMSDKSFKDFCDAFTHREDTLIMVNQLNQLIKCVQKHRGLSMTMLGVGGGEFKADFLQLQSQLERRLATMEVFAKKMNGVLSERDKENLHLAWETIRKDWQDDNLNDNFELHSHFVQQLLAMVSGLAKQLEAPLIDFSNVAETFIPQSECDQPQMFKQMEILNFAAKQLPALIECLAKVRGLASYAAAMGTASELDSRKLRYLIASTREEKLRIIAQAERLESFLLQDMPSLRAIKNIELKHIFLLNVVETDVLSGSVIVADAHQLFGLCTEIIDAYWMIVDEGLEVIRRWHSEDLDVWCKLGC